MDEEKRIPISPPAQEYRSYLRQRKEREGALPSKHERAQVKTRLRGALRNEERRESDYFDEIKRVGFDRWVIAQKSLMVLDNAWSIDHDQHSAKANAQDGRLISGIEELRVKAHAALEGMKDLSTPQKIAGIAILDLMLEQDAAELIAGNSFSQELEYKKDALDRTEFLRIRRDRFHMKSFVQRTAKKLTHTSYRKDEWAGFIDNDESDDMVRAIHDFFLKGVPKTEERQFSAIRRDFLSFIRMLASDPVLSIHVFRKVPAVHIIDEFAVRLNNMYESAAPIALSKSGMFIDPSAKYGTSAVIHIKELFDTVSSLIQRYIARSILQEHKNKPEFQRELAELNMTIANLDAELQKKEAFVSRTLFDKRFRAQRRDWKSQYDTAIARREEVYKRLEESYGRPVTKVVMDKDAENFYVFKAQNLEKKE